MSRPPGELSGDTQMQGGRPPLQPDRVPDQSGMTGWDEVKESGSGWTTVDSSPAPNSGPWRQT